MLHRFARSLHFSLKTTSAFSHELMNQLMNTEKKKEDIYIYIHDGRVGGILGIKTEEINYGVL